MQIIGSPPMPGNSVFVFRPTVVVQRLLQEFYFHVCTNVYITPLFDTVIFIQPFPYDLIHIACILVVV